MKKHILTSIVAVNCLMSSGVANSSEDKHDHSSHSSSQKKTHAAHEHGVAEMNLARLGKEVQIELSTPSFNLLGFEHQPKTTEQKAAVSSSEQILNSPSMLFSFEGATCDVEHVSVKSPFEHDDHADKHDHGHKADKHEHGHKEDEKSSHSEYTMSYHFDCKDFKGPLSINASALFSKFPNFSTIRTQWLSDNEQGSIELTSKNNELSIK